MENTIKNFESSAKIIGVNKSIISSYTNKLIDKSVRNLSTTVIEEAPNGSLISYDVYTRLLKDRVMYFCHPVTTETSNIAIAQLLFLEMCDPKKDITFYCMSPGGEVDSGSAVIDVFDYITCDVSTVGMGVVASMGSMLLSSGTKGKRFALPSARIMIHEPSSGFEGKSKDLLVNMEQLKILQERLYNRLVKNTGQTYKQIFEKCKMDYWVSSEEAVVEGLIDEVLFRKK